MKNKQKTKPINQGEWEKRFDDEFDHWVYLSDIKTGCNWNSFKSGIKSMFTYQRQQLIKEIEGIVGESEVEFHGPVDVTGILDKKTFLEKLKNLEKK